MVSNVTLDHETHRYYLDGTLFEGPSVTGALQQCGLADFSFLSEEDRQVYMQRGTAVHWATRLFDEGALNIRKLPHYLRPYLKAWRAFREATGFVPNPYWTERSFISKLGFSGTVDRVGSLKGMRFATLDIKSGDGEVPDWPRYQLSLYCEETKTANRVAVKLRPDGTYRTRPFPFSTFHTDRAIALEAVRRWRKDANN